MKTVYVIWKGKVDREFHCAADLPDDEILKRYGLKGGRYGVRIRYAEDAPEKEPLEIKRES